MNKQIFKLSHDEARRRAMAAVANAPDGFVVEVKEPTRSLEQNSKLHVMLSDISKHLLYGDQKRELDYWKAIIVDQWERESDRKPMIARGFDGQLINWRCSTADLSVSDKSSLIEFVPYIIIEKLGVNIDDLARRKGFAAHTREAA